MTDRTEQSSTKQTRQRLKDAVLIVAFCLAAAGTVYLYMTGQTEMQKLFQYADEYAGSK